MKKQMSAWILVLASLALVPAARAQDNTPPSNTGGQAGTSTSADAQEKNIQEYINLLRTDVRKQKTEIMGTMMQLSASDAAKFWPIYSEYDAELSKLNDLRAANIQEYARTYTQMTDEKADDLIQKVLAYDKQRCELLTKYYGHVKPQLGAITAARFVQVERQLLLTIDLQIASSLPIVGEGSQVP